MRSFKRGLLSRLAIHPAGIVHAYAGANVPAGFVLCDGQSLPATLYPELFAAIGYTYGGAGGNFNVPDLRGKFLRASGPGVALASTGGAASVTLAPGQLPAHSHALKALNADADTGNGGTNIPAGAALARGVDVSGTGGDPGYMKVGTPDTTLAAGSIGSTGNGDAVPTVPPFTGVNFIIYTGR